MKVRLFLLSAIAIIYSGCQSNLCQKIDVVSSLAAEQCVILSSNLDENKMPRTFQCDTLVQSNLKAWTSGFFPGTCWYAYMLIKDDALKAIAIEQTEKMVQPTQYLTDHDAGFQVMCSLGHAYKNTGEEKYRLGIKEAAEFLAGRYSAKTGVIKSWDHKHFEYPVIIDNMMNLELLTYASREFGVQQWIDMAISHADVTMRNHFREDGSSYHLVNYDPETGEVVQKVTVQGYSDDSAWSRGQSWGLYGYTMMYDETGYERYLNHAEKIASYLLMRLKDRPVPAWDFDADHESIAQTDASAAAVMASAFIRLSTLTKDKNKAKCYLSQAEAIMCALMQPEFLASSGEVGGFILKRSTGFYKNNREVNVPLTYADYYFLEALYNYKSLSR